MGYGVIYIEGEILLRFTRKNEIIRGSVVGDEVICGEEEFVEIFIRFLSMLKWFGEVVDMLWIKLWIMGIKLSMDDERGMIDSVG